MKVFFICLLTLVFTACSQTEKSKTNSIPKDKFNQIDSIVGTNNWQVIEGHDTSYLYFSRIGDALINVYRYQINKGDSVNTHLNIITHQQDSVIWNRENEKLLLVKAGDNALQWVPLNAPGSTYILQKTDSSHISFVFPDGHKTIMKRTLPLSTFLVRKQYDYAHGTSYVDSLDFQLRPEKKK
jgi:hypothetical protein